MSGIFLRPYEYESDVCTQRDIGSRHHLPSHFHRTTTTLQTVPPIIHLSVWLVQWQPTDTTAIRSCVPALTPKPHCYPGLYDAVGREWGFESADCGLPADVAMVNPDLNLMWRKGGSGTSVICDGY